MTLKLEQLLKLHRSENKVASVLPVRARQLRRRNSTQLSSSLSNERDARCQSDQTQHSQVSMTLKLQLFTVTTCFIASRALPCVRITGVFVVCHCIRHTLIMRGLASSALSATRLRTLLTVQNAEVIDFTFIRNAKVNLIMKVLFVRIPGGQTKCYMNYFLFFSFSSEGPILTII